MLSLLARTDGHVFRAGLVQKLTRQLLNEEKPTGKTRRFSPYRRARFTRREKRDRLYGALNDLQGCRWLVRISRLI